jgi:hypothetical protein
VNAVVAEVLNGRPVVSQNFFDLAGGTVAATNPYDLGWKSSQETSLVKVRILRNNRVSMGPGVVPDGLIVSALMANKPHVSGSWIKACQVFDEAIRQVLIEK